MDLSSLGYTKKGIYLMYDPHDVQEEELLEILQEMICHFEEYEEYEKCQEIKNIIDDNELRDLIPIITISKEELEEARLTMPEDQYEQEFECSFQAAVSGSYYGKQIQKAEK